MPFTPLPDSGPEKPKPSDFGLLTIRILVAAIFFYYQLIDQLVFAKKYIWDKADWDLVEQLKAQGLFYTGPIAVVIVIALFLSFLGIVVGVFTRINALVLFVVLGFVFLIPLDLSPTLTPQSLALYLSIFLALACGGAGRVSLDYFMAGKKTDRKSA